MHYSARCALIIATIITAAPATADISQLSFLTGCWLRDGHEAGSIEQWTAPAGHSMLALNRTVRNGRTVAFEFIRIIEQDDGEIVFIASPSGQATAQFSMVSISDREVVFENANHDFPQRIIYHLIDAGKLLGRIEGVVNNEHRTVDFPMTRTDCDSATQAE